MVLKLRVMQFWSEIILMISNRTRAARSFDLKNTRMISNQFALHSDWLSLLIKHNIVTVQWGCYVVYQEHCFIFHDSLSLSWNLGPFSPLSEDFNRFQASDFSQRYYIFLADNLNFNRVAATLFSPSLQNLRKFFKKEILKLVNICPKIW